MLFLDLACFFLSPSPNLTPPLPSWPLPSSQAVVVQQDSFVEDQRLALSERLAAQPPSRNSSSSSSLSQASGSSSSSSRPSSLIEQEKQRCLERQRQEAASLQVPPTPPPPGCPRSLLPLSQGGVFFRPTCGLWCRPVHRVHDLEPQV